VLGVTGIIIGANILMGLNEVSKRYSVLFDKDVGWRSGVWNWSLKVALDYPIAGTGLGTFQFVSPMYKTPETNAGQFDEAHNDYLNLWSDTGTVGLLLGVSFIVVWLAVILRGMGGSKRHQNFLLAGCVASLFAMLVHSIGDFNLQIPSNAAYLAIILGIGVALAEKSHDIRATAPVTELPTRGVK
jgi:O-antigen ligase